MSPRGRFITFEGLDGTGKTTQLDLLADWLRTRGHDVVATREPGGTPAGEQIRALVLRPTSVAFAPATELALMAASRAQSVAQLILPALARGAVVLCDRFHDATEAYQGGGRGLDLAAIHTLHRVLCRDLQPHRTIILELDAATCLRRAHARTHLVDPAGPDRFERQQPAFFDRVAIAYRLIARREPHRCRLLAATGDPAALARRVRDAVADLFDN